MLARRFAFGVSAAAVLAVAGFVPATASGAATKPICVGLIVDAHAVNGPTTAKCVTVRQGTTGIGVLEAGGHTVTFRRDGLLCTIDGLPKTGCSAVDDTHYWAYFHRAPDSTTWTYSNEGGGTYRPANRSTDGWVYDDGSKLEPKNVPAGQMCAALLQPNSKPKPTPTPTATPARSARPRHSPVTSASPALSPTRMTATKKPHRERSQHAARRPAERAATAAAPITSASASAPSSSNGSHGHGNATGALVAAGVIAAIAIATLISARRRH